MACQVGVFFLVPTSNWAHTQLQLGAYPAGS